MRREWFESAKLQQYLPFTVLKHESVKMLVDLGIKLQQYLPFTVLKLRNKTVRKANKLVIVATVLTVYGIETYSGYSYIGFTRLQQYLPFTVLKL